MKPPIRRQAIMEQEAGNHRKHSDAALLSPAIPRSDLGNAQRFILHHGSSLQYVKQWGRWVAWDGKRWTEDDSCEIMHRAKETSMALYQAACRLRAGPQLDFCPF